MMAFPNAYDTAFAGRSAGHVLFPLRYRCRCLRQQQVVGCGYTGRMSVVIWRVGICWFLLWSCLVYFRQKFARGRTLQQSPLAPYTRFSHQPHPVPPLLQHGGCRVFAAPKAAPHQLHVVLSRSDQERRRRYTGHKPPHESRNSSAGARLMGDGLWRGCMGGCG